MKKKAVKIVNLILSVVMFAFSLFILFNVVSAKSQNKPVYIFDHTLLVVVTDSMTPELEVGDFVLAKKIDIDDVQLGDNVVYVAKSGSLRGYRIIHKVVNIEVVDGNTILTTQGIKFGAPLDGPISDSDIVGVQVYHSSALGKVITFFSNVWNWIFIAILVALVIFGARQVKKIIKEVKRNADGSRDNTDSGKDTNEK